MVDEIVEVFSTMVGVTSGILGLKKSTSIVRRETSKKEKKTPPKSKMRRFL
jgi:hypothetical protein